MIDIQLWKGPNGVIIPPHVSESNELVSYAASLSERHKNQIVSAFQVGAYDMAAEFAWKKAMVKLQETISTLGMEFIGEILNRDDIDEYSTIDTALTDYTTIQLAEQLGVINSTAALKLKQCNELITHFFSNKATEEIDKITAMQIVKSSIEYVLAESDISIAIEFSNFRRRLLNETLSLSDEQLDQIINSPLFYLRTVVSILTSSIKNDNGAKLEHALANFNLILPQIWKKLGENDKWNIGTAYRDVTAAGNTSASSGLKNALLKVKGFDYVPENLRSVTFKKAAAAVIDTHFKFNNFYNEPAVVRRLANLGSTIPSPALLECMQAYLTVYIGNSYGISGVAADIAEEKLQEISYDRWKYYFEKGIQTDEIILSKLVDETRIKRLRHLINIVNLNDLVDLPKDNQELYTAILAGKYRKVVSVAKLLLKRIKPQ